MEDEDEDVYLDVDDTDIDDFHVQGMDLDIDEIWEVHTGHRRNDAQADDVDADADAEMDGDEDDSEWGLTDGESESMTSSDGDMTVDESNDGEDDVNNAGTLGRGRSAAWLVQLTIIALLLFSVGNGG